MNNLFSIWMEIVQDQAWELENQKPYLDLSFQDEKKPSCWQENFLLGW